jgi:hypothetical protein
MKLLELFFSIITVILICSIITLSIIFIGLEPTVVGILSNLIFLELNRK